MIYKFETTLGVSYYQDSETSIVYMSVEDYCVLAKKSLASVSYRDSETIKIESCCDKPVTIELITQKTIIQWLMKDCPELILELVINGLQNYLIDATDD